MNSLQEIPPDKMRAALDRIEMRALKDGGEPPDNGDMEARIAKLEALAEKTGERLAAIDVKLAKIETRMDEGFKNFSTTDGMKAAVAEAKNSIIMWVVSAILLAQLLPALLKKFGL